MNDYELEVPICYHDWAVNCDGAEHLEICTVCGDVNYSPCPDVPDSDAGTWSEEEE